MNWELVEKVTGMIQNVTVIITVIVGAVWGYFKFVRFRTLKPRLEFSFDWLSSGGDGKEYIGVLALRLSNKGNTKVELRKNSEHRCILKYGIIPAAQTTEDLSIISLSDDQLQHCGRVFSAHKWIEPNETIDDVRVLHIRNEGARAIQFEVMIFDAHKHKWSASTAFPLTRDHPIASSQSEDEQDDSEDWKIDKEILGSRISDAKRLLSSLQEKDGRRGPLEKIIQEAELLLNRLEKDEITKTDFSENASKLIKKFSVYIS
jgi:hypothetical protein